jgi:hypothetical protein
MTSLVLALLLSQTLPSVTATPGKEPQRAISVQGITGGTPVEVSGTLSAAGAADTVGSTATFDSNSDCAFVATAGQTGAGFFLAAGTLAATLTPSVSVDSTNGTNGTWVATSFVDIDGNTASTLVVTNPNAATARGLKLMSGTRYARVCTTAFTSGSTTGNLIASTPEPPPPAAGADVTDRAARLLGVISAGTNNIGDVDVASIAAGDTDIGNVDLEFAGTAASTGNGASGAQTLRVTVANDSTGTTKINDGTDTALVSGSGALNVTCDNCGGSTFADNSAFTFGTTPIQIAGYVFDDVAPNAATENRAATPRMSSNRVAYAQLRDAAGNERGANVTAGNALVVDGSAVTQPVSGTVTVTDGAGALNTIIDSGSVTVSDGAGALNVIVDSGAATVTGPAADGAALSGNPVRIAGSDGTNAQNIVTDAAGELQVDVLTLPSVTIGTFPDNEPINVAQMNGVAVTMGNGAAGTGVQRVTIASDSTGQVAVASLPNEGQQTAANSISVTPDSDNDSIGATASAVPGEATYMGGTDGTNLVGIYVDPCQREAKSFYRIDIVTATTVEIAAATASEHHYICSINLVAAGADNVIIVEDDTATNCPSPTAGVSSGGTTAAEGWNFAANGGLTQGDGSSAIMRTSTANRSICIITSAAVQLSGVITYVTAP